MVILNTIKPWSPNVSKRHTPTCICDFLSLLMSACRILNLPPTRTIQYPNTEVLSGGATQKQNNGLALWEKAFTNLKNFGSRAEKQRILYRHVTAGHTAFVVTWLFSSLAKVSQLRQDLQRLSSDDHVIQWICLRKNNVSSDTRKRRLQEARSMILGCVPLTTSTGLRYPLLMWNA